MKKRLLALAMTGVLSMSLLAGCGSKETPAATPAEGGTEASAEGGSVYYLNFKPEADQAWQALAKTYTE